jgi:hypothetical protein
LWKITALSKESSASIFMVEDKPSRKIKVLIGQKKEYFSWSLPKGWQ